MKSIFTLFRQLSLIVVLISAFSLSAWGEEVTCTYTPSEHLGSSTITLGSGEYTINSDLTFTANQSDASNQVGYNKDGSLRLYYASSGNGCYITINPKNNVIITEIVLTATSTSYTPTVKYNIDGGVDITGTWSSTKMTISNISAKTSFKFRNANTSSKQLRIKSIVIKYTTSSGGDPETPCTNPTISFAENTITKTNGESSFTNTLTTNSSGAVTYTSSATNVATVDNNGQVTINGVGTTTITATVAADGTYCEATDEYTLTVEGRSFDITWMNGSETHTTTSYTEGQPLELPTDPTSCSDNYSTFVGWYTQQAGPTSTPSTELQGTEASKTDITGPTIFYAVFGDANGASIPTESSIDFSVQNYTNQQEISSVSIAEGITIAFDKGTNSNSPKYYTNGTAIRVYGGGYFTITSETTISSITITFGSDDGSNTITTDCGTYSDGKWTGSANSVKFTIGGTSGNRRIKGISVTTTSLSSSAYISTCDGEEVIIPEAPTFNPAGGDFTETQSVEISAEDGAMIYYTTNGDDPTTESILYNGAIEVSTTTPIKAIAVLNGVESSVSEAEYRINIIDDIATFITKAPTVETKISGTVTVVAQDQWKQRTWIQDTNGSAMIDNSSKDVELTFGDQLKGIVGTFSSNNINVTSLPEKEATTAIPTTKETKTIGEITTNDLHKYIRIENVTFGGVSGTNATFTDETNSIKTYESYLQTDYSSINEGQKVNLNAIVGVYSGKPQIYVVSFDIVREPAIYADDIVDFGDVIENNESTKTITITTVDLGEPANVSILGDYFSVETESIDDDSETEITITFTAPDVDVKTERTATLTITGGGQTKEIALTATVKPLLALTANINGLTQEIGAFVEGADITSALDAINVTAPEGWSFAGWVANAIDGSQTTTPEYLTTMPAEATTAYAVFKLGKEVNKEFSFAITAADFNETSYTANNNEKTSTATAIDGTETEVKWTSYQVMLQEKAMQWQKSNGYIYNSTDLGTITDIDITSSAGTFTTHKGTSEKPTSEGEGGYFQIKTGTSAVGKTSGVTITFEKSVLSYTYRTSVLSLVVENNTTETISENVNSLTLHVDKTPNTQLEVTETITADKVTVIQTIDASRWFFFSLPFDCNVANIVATYVNGGAELEYAPDASTGDYVIAEYDGTNSWVELLGDNNPTLKANQGYIIGHFGSGDVTVKFPSNGAQNISAPANATLEKTSNNGFNLIGLPYFQKVNASLNNVNHLSIPNEDGETYNQTEDLSLLASIAPFTSFFVQTEAENIEFTLGAQQNAAPRLDGRSNRASLHKAVVTLTDANGGADKTTIINNPSKTTDYEIGHDLTKLIGYAEIPQIYSLQGDEMLAFNSLAIDNSTVIPLGVYAHADGDYTFSLSEKSVGDLEGWELYDNETGKTTRLANEDLTVNLAQGTHEGRFEIRLQQHISTDCDNTMGDMTTWTANGTLNINNLPADAVVYIYDAVGRMVYVANNNSTTFNYTFAARGVYNIVVRTAENSVSFKTIY